MKLLEAERANQMNMGGNPVLTVKQPGSKQVGLILVDSDLEDTETTVPNKTPVKSQESIPEDTNLPTDSSDGENSEENSDSEEEEQMEGNEGENKEDEDRRLLPLNSVYDVLAAE